MRIAAAGSIEIHSDSACRWKQFPEQCFGLLCSGADSVQISAMTFRAELRQGENLTAVMTNQMLSAALPGILMAGQGNITIRTLRRRGRGNKQIGKSPTVISSIACSDVRGLLQRSDQGRLNRCCDGCSLSPDQQCRLAPFSSPTRFGGIRRVLRLSNR